MKDMKLANFMKLNDFSDVNRIKSKRLADMKNLSKLRAVVVRSVLCNHGNLVLESTR